MTETSVALSLASQSIDFEPLFEKVCNDLNHTGFSINPMALPFELALELRDYALSLKPHLYEKAGVGREIQFNLNQFVRTDEIYWLNGQNDTENRWLNWTNRFKDYLNKRLFLGLFSFESHFACYNPGHFYKRHFDAFKGQANRVLSLVVYLNNEWLLSDGGELVIYQCKEDIEGTRVQPGFGTLVVFLSEEFPHEVLPANRDRLSIAGWFSVNRSVNNQIDPPV